MLTKRRPNLSRKACILIQEAKSDYPGLIDILTTGCLQPHSFPQQAQWHADSSHSLGLGHHTCQCFYRTIPSCKENLSLPPRPSSTNSRHATHSGGLSFPRSYFLFIFSTPPPPLLLYIYISLSLCLINLTANIKSQCHPQHKYSHLWTF